MRIVYLAEIDPFAASGGGEKILRGFIEAGRSRGHHIEVYTPTTLPPWLPYADLYVLADIYNEPNKQGRVLFSDHIIQSIVNQRQFVKIDCGYCDVCNKDYLPCSGSIYQFCSDCPARGDAT